MNIFFCHAGVNGRVSLDNQNDDDLLWIREQFLNNVKNYGKIIVHGHTPTWFQHNQNKKSHLPIVRKNRICIDTGCYYGGLLTALKINKDGIDFISVPGFDAKAFYGVD